MLLLLLLPLWSPKGDQILRIGLRIMVRNVNGRIRQGIDRGIVQGMGGRIPHLRREGIALTETILADTWID